MKNRRRSREACMQILYQMSVRSSNDYESMLSWYEEELDFDYIRLVLTKYIENATQIDNAIAGKLKNWSFDRVAEVDKAIMKLSITELLFINDIDVGVSISEAVNLAKKFAHDNAHEYINGVLKNFSERKLES